MEWSYGVPTPEDIEMSNRILARLLLLTAFAVPAFSQQTSPNSDVKPSGSGTQTDSSKAPEQRSSDFWDGDEPNLTNLLAHPFASKGYVRRQTQAIKDQINELDELTISNTKMLKDVDTRAQQGIQLASSKANEADERASAAVDKAQSAQVAVNQVTTHLSTVEQAVSNFDEYKDNAQAEIQFRPGETVLSKVAKDALDELATPLKDQHNYIIEVRGFASGRGQNAFATSKELADSVVRYLVLNDKIPVYRIYVIGMGSTPKLDTGDGTKSKRALAGRVEVSLLKNELRDQMQH